MILAFQTQKIISVPGIMLISALCLKKWYRNHALMSIKPKRNPEVWHQKPRKGCWIIIRPGIGWLASVVAH